MGCCFGQEKDGGRASSRSGGVGKQGPLSFVERVESERVCVCRVRTVNNT